MKQILILMLALMTSSAVFGQESKKKVAIYTDDKSGKNYVEFAGEFLTNAIVKRGDYEAYERTNVFLQLISKEQGYQRSGAVSEDRIAKLGKQLGVQLVCAVRIGVTDGQYFISAKLINVETASIEGSSRPQWFSAGDFTGFEKACENITASLFGERVSSHSDGGSSASGNSRTSTEDNKNRNSDAYNYEGIELVFVEGTEGALGMHSFYIGKYEVTQSQYQKVMGNNPSSFKTPNNPVENVSWEDAQEFLNKLNAMSGRNYRLPTEDEWVYAANGGLKNDSYEYAGNNNIDEVAWYKDNSAGRTHPVGTKAPNSIGIYDMTGNVWEWCQDCYDSSCTSRVYRGGSWNRKVQYCRVAYRNYNSPSDFYDNIGFRLAHSSE
jgi:hypothetical protein